MEQFFHPFFRFTVTVIQGIIHTFYCHIKTRIRCVCVCVCLCICGVRAIANCENKRKKKFIQIKIIIECMVVVGCDDLLCFVLAPCIYIWFCSECFIICWKFSFISYRGLPFYTHCLLKKKPNLNHRSYPNKEKSRYFCDFYFKILLIVSLKIWNLQF